MLEISGLNVHYGNVQALWDVSLDIREGEIVALLGANGAGKTTLLNAVTGVVPFSGGSVKLQGKELRGTKNSEILELGIAYLPEGGRLFPEMTIQENLEMGAYPRSLWKVRRANIERMYDTFPRLRECKRQLARTMSGGEQQMLAMGRALMSNPKLCLFDELSYGLAPILVKEVFNVVKRLRDEGMTIMLVEQNAYQTLEICDRAYILENGRIVLSGAGKELLTDDYVRKAYLGL
jgi:branched-chain amino acid transport system ATP-binding protein